MAIKSSIRFYFFNMNGGNKWTEMNWINEYLWSQQSVRLALSWFPWKTNENDSVSIDGTIIQFRHSSYWQIKQNFEQQFKIMKFRMSKEQGYPLNDPGAWPIGIIQGQGPSLQTQFKDDINGSTHPYELITLTSPLYINKLWRNKLCFLERITST